MPNIIDSRVQTDAKDFLGFKQAFFEFGQSEFSEIWTDFNEDQFMVLIADMISYLGDIVTYYIDKQTSENFLTTAQRRQSIIDIGIMLDYRLQSPVPSTGEVTLTLDPAIFDYGTPISEGHQFSNGGTLIFEATQDVSVPAASTSITVPIIEGETIRETNLGIGPVGQSNGTTNQRFTLERTNVILANNLIDLPSDIEVTVGSIPYSPVFNIHTALSTEEVYHIETDEDNISTLQFGNSVSGAIPPTSVDIEATYRALKVEREENNYGKLNATAVDTDEESRDGILEVSNSVALVGGRIEESKDEAKANIPLSVKAGNRAVSPDDFKTLALEVQQAAKAVALPGTALLDMDLYIAPEGGGFPDQALKNEVITYFESRKLARTKVFPRDPIYQPVDLDFRVQVSGNNRNVDVQEALETALSDLFSFTNLDFGQGIYQKSTGGANDIFDINETLEGVSGIDNIKYNKIALKPFIYDKKFTNSGTPTLLEDSCKTRSGSKRKEIEIAMQSTTRYLVKTKIFGDSTSINDTRLEDTLRTFLLDEGDSSAVGTSFLKDASKFMTVDEFQFQTLIDSAGIAFKIISNTQDQFNLESGTPAAGDYQIVERLVGYYLNPNINQSSVFLIISNDINSVTVASGLSEVAVLGNTYEIYRYETNKFHTDAHEGTETSGTATATTFVDVTAIGFGNDFYNGMVVFFQEGPAANIPVEVIDFVSASGTFTVQSLGTGNEPLSGNRYVVAPRFILGKNCTVSTTPAPTTTAFSADQIGGEGNDFYNEHKVHFQSGLNEDQNRKVIDYDDAGDDTLTINPLDDAPTIGDSFQLAKEYQSDDQTFTFAVISENPSAADIYVFQISTLVGDLTPKENQILQLNSADLKLTVFGGS